MRDSNNLSHAMCVQGMCVVKQDKDQHFVHTHVFMLCRSRVHVDLGFHVVIGVGRLNV